MRIVIVPDDLEGARAAVVVRFVRAVRPLENGAPARRVGNHVVIGRLRGVVHVVLLDERDRLLHRARIVEHHAQHGRGREVGLVRLLVGCDRLLAALVGHVDAAAHARIVDAVQGREGRRKAGDLVHQPLHVLRGVHAEELQVHRREGLVPAVAGICKDERRVGAREVIVAGEDPVAVRRDRGERTARDLALRDGHVDEPARDIVGDKVDEFAVTRRAALQEIVVKIEVARDVHAVHRPVEVLLVAVCDLGKTHDRRDLVPPDDRNRADERDAEDDDHDQRPNDDLGPQGKPALGCLRCHNFSFHSLCKQLGHYSTSHLICQQKL